MIVGGHFQYVAISDFAMLDESSKSWKRISSLSSPRKYVAVVPITKDTILVLGGSTGGKGAAECMAHSITTVEKGRATLKYTK